ncbi:MAG: hypothetical protein IKU86_08590, partial [Thermoguttaceae bacterium]|nr:hypothetical protein [Thermoguttaceae bacterium]
LVSRYRQLDLCAVVICTAAGDLAACGGIGGDRNGVLVDIEISGKSNVRCLFCRDRNFVSIRGSAAGA